jgi:trehalose 2-sulfotransferase
MANLLGFDLSRLSLRLGLLRDPFRNIAFDADKHARHLRKPPATLTYAILFTPRSGSSRLTEILKQTRVLSQPGEPFNPGMIPGMARAFNASDLEQYIAIMRRRRNTGGIMGFEITYSQLRGVFGSIEAFRRATTPDKWFWLVREDIVLQAISISRVRQSQIWHDNGLDAAARTRAEEQFIYDGRVIATQILKLRWMEKGTEAMFARFGVSPVRLSYERLIGVDPAMIAAIFAQQTGAVLPPDLQFDLTHQKLGTDKNLAFAERFRARNPRFVARIDRARKPMLEALDDIPASP